MLLVGHFAQTTYDFNGVSLTWAEGQQPHLEIRQRHNPEVLITRFLCGIVGLALLSELVSRSTYLLNPCKDANVSLEVLRMPLCQQGDLRKSARLCF